MDKEVKNAVAAACGELFDQDVEPKIDRPEEQFGDFTTNVALQLAGKLQKPPREVAEIIVDKIKNHQYFSEVTIAGPGFINIRLNDQVIFNLIKKPTDIEQSLSNRVVVAEYSDPNPFKALHAGHLYTTLVGDSISNILESAGATVYRVNFGGDVGLHVAKAMWGIISKLGGTNPEKLSEIEEADRAEWINRAYSEGHAAYESDDSVKQEIDSFNQEVYKLHNSGDHESDFAKIYWTCRDWSYKGFDILYQKLRVKPFDKYYPESEVDSLGFETVNKHLGGVYEESEGAVVFKGEKYGLFTQVFINSQGLSTYAAKDVGLIQHKQNDYKPDISYIITDVSQKDHLAVVMKSIEQFEPELVRKTIHQTHGRVKLPGGQKMSSRQGKVIMANDVLEAAKQTAKNQEDNDIIVGAVRYSFLKSKVGGDIVYDPVESVSHEGNSGPYLQYALVRAKGILAKLDSAEEVNTDKLEKYERSLARKLSIYREVFNLSLEEYSSHHICNYLYELAQNFNRFYENCKVKDDPREAIRSQLVRSYEEVLEHGLDVLGVPKPERI